jgi:SAM-dependent methyltransferase
MKPLPDVARDFDLIASALADSPADRRLTAAERVVLEAIPAAARSAIDVGCGDGHLARAIARRGTDVTAIDVAPGMIALARARTRPDERVDYRIADVMSTDVPASGYDAVVSVNMVHHLPLRQIVPRLAALVAPGGVLVIQDVVERSGLRHLPINLMAGAWTQCLRLLGRDDVPSRVRRLYDQHGRGEAYLEPSAVADALSTHLPGVRVAHHLGWRYTAVWSRALPPIASGR